MTHPIEKHRRMGNFDGGSFIILQVTTRAPIQYKDVILPV